MAERAVEAGGVIVSLFLGLSVSGSTFGEQTLVSVPQWGPWGPWSDCSKTCAMGLRLRSRQCLLEGTNGTQAVSPQACGPGSGRQREFCDTRTPCPIDGGWGPWSELICSRTCGSGLGKRTRTCNNPSPQFGGAECQGSEWDMAKCQGEPCPSVLQTVPHMGNCGCITDNKDEAVTCAV
ncbi:hypothetical protein HPB47_008665 [Ixodes persulcatus]|uniref:Uncharacterized protein n=1 Tax=Ixodes persulcatus TaxID=34615 RepID=A0AC60P463_IXOPE|nr:hypothetical protein HPB47_008665 [Ixodes persulcatus]